MPDDFMTTQTSIQAAAQDTLIANLRNAHALESQVIAVLEPQLDLLPAYTDLHARVTRHIAETRDQLHRLEIALAACDSSPSMVKDALLSMMGLGQSSVQGFSDDAVLKATAADMMTEHLEIATYRSLIVLADMAGKPELRAGLEASLHEEEAMAEWFNQNLEAITRRFVEIKAAEDGQGQGSAPGNNSVHGAVPQKPLSRPNMQHGSAASGLYRDADDRASLGDGGIGHSARPTRLGDN